VDEVAAARLPISIITAAPEARAALLQARLHKVEFPFRFPVARKARSLGPTEERRLILDNKSPLQEWTPVRVSWPRPDGPVESRCEKFVKNLVMLSPHSRSQKVDSDLSGTVSDYFTGLKSKRWTALRLFAFSPVPEADVLREPHATLAGRLHELFADGPPDRFRLLISAGPRTSQARPRWIEKAERPIVLGEVALSDLEQWIGLMTLLVDKTESELRQILEQAFNGPNSPRRDSGSRLSFAALVEALRPHAERWPLRNKRVARRFEMQSTA
jgi:hypothetical protein